MNLLIKKTRDPWLMFLFDNRQHKYDNFLQHFQEVQCSNLRLNFRFFSYPHSPEDLIRTPRLLIFENIFSCQKSHLALNSLIFVDIYPIFEFSEVQFQPPFRQFYPPPLLVTRSNCPRKERQRLRRQL